MSRTSAAATPDGRHPSHRSRQGPAPRDSVQHHTPNRTAWRTHVTTRKTTITAKPKRPPPSPPPLPARTGAPDAATAGGQQAAQDEMAPLRVWPVKAPPTWADQGRDGRKPPRTRGTPPTARARPTAHCSYRLPPSPPHGARADRRGTRPRSHAAARRQRGGPDPPGYVVWLGAPRRPEPPPGPAPGEARFSTQRGGQRKGGVPNAGASSLFKKLRIFIVFSSICRKYGSPLLDDIHRSVVVVECEMQCHHLCAYSIRAPPAVVLGIGDALC